MLGIQEIFSQTTQSLVVRKRLYVIMVRRKLVREGFVEEPELSHKEFMEVNHVNRMTKSRPPLGKTRMNLQRLRTACCIIEH